MAEETKIIRIVVDSSKAVDGSAAATRAMERLEKAQRDVDSSLGRMERSLDRMGGFLKAQLALAIAELGARLVQMGKDSLNAVAGLDELAEQLGITTTGLQALQFSAVQNGVKLEQLETGISKFSQKMGEAANGSKEMVEALNGLGIKNLDAQGKLRPTEVLLREVAEAITKMEDPAKRSAAAVEFFGKAGARMLPMLGDIAAGTDVMAQKAAAAGAMIDASVIKQLDKLADNSEKSGLKFRALVATLGAPIATEAMEAVNNILGKLLGNLKDLEAQRLRSEQGVLPEADMEMLRSRAEYWNNRAAKERTNARVQTMAERSSQALANATKAAGLVESPAERTRIVSDQYATQLLVSGTFAPTEPLDAPGASTSTVKGAGDDVTERLRKTLQESKRGLDEATGFAAAANQGADAVARLEIHFKALKTAQDVFGKAANENSQEVKDLTAKLEGQAVATQKLKAVGDFRLATDALRDQNELLAAEIRLTNELPEIRARELALIKLAQEEKAKGQKFSEEDRKARLEALDTGERLKIQAEEIRRSNELWTAPLKSALESIQKSSADWIDALLQGLEQGKVTVEDFGKAGIAIARRMVAEFLALALIRPMLGSVVGGLSSMGVVSPQTAASLGYGQGANGTSLSLPSGMGGGIGGSMGFWNRPIANSFGRDINSEIANWSTYGTPQQNSLGGGFLGDITWGQGIGAAAGIGMGAYQLATANGSMGKTIGGIGSMIGAGVSLIPGIGQIAGPIISIVSSLLPSLIGEPERRTHNSTNASLRYGAGGYGTSGGAWGPGANVSQSQAELGQVGSNIGAVYDLFGGVKDASKVWGMDLSSWTASGNNWSYTSRATHLVDPSGNRSAWRMNEDNMVDTASAQVAMRSILGGAVGAITENMRTAVTAMLPATTTLQDVAKGVSFVSDVYEKLGKTLASIEPDFDALEKQFKDMASTATSLGLSLAPVEAERQKQTERLAQDYIDNLIDPVAAALRGFADEKATILANVEYISQNTDVIVDMARVNEALLRKEAALKEQLYGGAVSQLEDAIKRLSYGNLSNATSAGTLAGMRGALYATVAQARAGDGDAIGRLAGEITSFGDANRSYFASGPQYEAIRQELLALAREFQLQVAGPMSSAGTDAATTASNNAEFNRMLAQFMNENADLKQQVATLVATMERLVAKR